MKELNLNNSVVMSEPVISVVVPVYGVEKFIKKCLLSITSQTYKNLEIIFVDDATKDRSIEIIRGYAKNDNRIKVVSHENNKGLFAARVTGMKAARGEYVAFVDSDDYVSCDWFRCLLKKAIEEDAEMVIGNTVNVDETGAKTIYNNYQSLTISNRTLHGRELIFKLMEQEGSCFAWHTVWNKLYKKELVEKCMPYFERITGHLIMGEDIAYSSVFFSLANSLAFANVDAYFYYRHSEASTSLSLPKEKIQKNLGDIGYVFKYAEECIRELNKDIIDEIMPFFLKFKEKYFRTWSSNLLATGYGNDEEMVNILCSAFEKEHLEETIPHEFYFYEITTYWSERYEVYKKTILDENIEYVSFDMFDTLVKRPLYQPTDIFYFVAQSSEVKKNFRNAKSFYDMRILAENMARKKLESMDNFYEDVNLTEIYECLCEIGNLTKESGNKIQKYEEQLEIRFCEKRESVKELYDLALHCGKKVIITSDMYLHMDTIEKILSKNDYTQYVGIYLSSETRRLKAKGTLFNFLLQDLEIDKAESVLHIGDNWNSDILVPQQYNIRTLFIPKCSEVFENKISDIITGDLAEVFTKNLEMVQSNNELMKMLPIRCMVACASNKLFDQPFKNYQPDSIYNSDTYLSGYYTLGMHMFGMALWMYRIYKKEDYQTIHFLARDGNLIKKVFDYLCQELDEFINTNYFYATRKSLLPYIINDKKDFFDIYQYIDVYQHTVREILEIFKPILLPLTKDLEKKYEEKGILLEKKIESHKGFICMAKAIGEVSYDKKYAQMQRTDICSMMSDVFGENDVTFDIGYSGRLQAILCQLSDKHIDAFYIHNNGADSNVVAEENGFKIHSFYDFTPKISGIIREFFISDPAPSCIGYEIENNKLNPILEEKMFSYQEVYPIRKFQQGAYDYCCDMISIFSEYLDMFDIRPLDASAAFEHYLLNATQCDRYVYSSCLVEDDVYAGYSSKSLFDIWTWHLDQISRKIQTLGGEVPVVETTMTQNAGNDLYGHDKYPFLYNKSKLKKAWFYFWYDRPIFHEKFSFWKKIHRDE